MGSDIVRAETAESWGIRQWGLAFLASLALLWPALVNGGPFWFPDTPTYIRGADAAAVYATGQRSEWSDRIVVQSPATLQSTDAAGDGGGAVAGGKTITPTRPVLMGRSVYYGAMIFGLLTAGGPWLAVLAQCLLVGMLATYAVWRVMRLTASAHSGKAFLLAPVLAVVSPMAYFACMFMPDVFAGLGMLTLCVALVFWSRLSVVDKAIFAGSSAVFATFHTTHILIFAVLTAAAIVRALLVRRPVIGPLVAGSAVVAAGIVSTMVFAAAVRHTTSVEPESPPFLTARLQANGLGMDYMAVNCSGGEDSFAACRYRAQLPVPSDAFLWSADAKEGVVQVVPEDERRALAAEDKRFFFAVAAHDPVRFAGIALSAAAQQLTDFDFDVFNYAHRAPVEIRTVYPPAIADQILATRAAQGTMPGTAVLIASIISAFCGALYLVWFLFTAYRARRAASELVALVGLILVGVLANAMICGALSGSKARYQMRLIWTVPAVVLIVGAAHMTQARRGQTFQQRPQAESIP